MPVDNEYYNRAGDIWWNENEVLSSLRTMVNPGRFPYFREALVRKLGLDVRGKMTLDVGCGGGILAEEFARMGCCVTGIDPSASSLETARAHARQEGLDIEYVKGAGEEIPFGDEAFEMVYCCDVLEHVDDVEKVIGEIARVLRPGGVFFYDTINRTFLSKLVVIKFAQEWRMTRFMPPNLHDWGMFIQPRELRQCMRRHGLESQEIVGLKPSFNPIRLLWAMMEWKRGKMTLSELGKHLQFRQSRDVSVSYMGIALKTR